MRLSLTVVLTALWQPVDAGHCYSISGQAACDGDARGAACAFCNGACQMATDPCANAIPQDQLPGSPFFEDMSSLLTTNPTQKNYGISVTDIDADGTFEFVVAGFGAPNQAFKWDASHEKFTDIALGDSVMQDRSGMAIGLAACDVDGDGFEELYVLNTDSYGGQTTTSDKLLDRDESGTFRDILAGANFVAGRSCACVDRLGNGRYGVMVANYGGPMRLYEMAEGAGAPTDVAPSVGMDKTTGGRALIAGPLVTNRMDVFANNEGYSGRRLGEEASNTTTDAKVRRLSHRLNFMFAHDGSGSFTDVAADVGLLDASQTGRGTAILDSNGDGLLDIVYGNWNGPHRLYVQQKDADNCAKFVDQAPAAMSVASPIRTVIVADFDNDGYEEIFWNNIPGANLLFRKLPTDADWTQVKIGDALEESGHGTGAAVGDFNGDGLLELVVAHGESAAEPLSYFRPKAGLGNHYLRVLPLTAQGAPARGSKVSLTAGGRTQTRVIDAGSGYLCQMEPVAHFGLGSLVEVDSVTVIWPDGAAHVIANPSIDQLLRVPRPEGLVPLPYAGRCDIHPAAATAAPAAASAEPEPEPEPEATVTTTPTASTISPTEVPNAPTTSSSDSLAPSATPKVIGSLALDVNDAAAFVEDAKAKTAVAKSIASSAGVDESAVSVTLTVGDRRRLAGDGGLRRLTGSVLVNYEIAVPGASADEQETSASALVEALSGTDTVSMTATITEKLAEVNASADYGVAVTSIPAPNLATAAPTETPAASAQSIISTMPATTETMSTTAHSAIGHDVSPDGASNGGGRVSAPRLALTVLMTSSCLASMMDSMLHSI